MGFIHAYAVIGVAVAALFMSVVAWLFMGNPQKEEGQPTAARESVHSAETARLVAPTDTDGDGLFDWEETLRGTNPQLMDTDGDGTSDNDEVRLGRNALLAGSDNVEHEVVRRLQDLRRPAPFFSASRVPDPSSPDQKSQRVGQSAQTSAVREVLRDYGNALGRAIATHALPVEKELALWNHTAGTTTRLGPEVAAEFRALSSRHGAAAQVATSAAAGAPVTEARLLGVKLADSYRTLSDAVAAIATAGEEGRIEGELFMRYSAAAIEVAKTIIDIGRFFSAHGVRFAPDESGAIFALPYYQEPMTEGQ